MSGCKRGVAGGLDPGSDALLRCLSDVLRSIVDVRSPTAHCVLASTSDIKIQCYCPLNENENENEAHIAIAIAIAGDSLARVDRGLSNGTWSIRLD